MREGEHIGAVTYAREQNTPSFASRSREGVLICLDPVQPKSPYPRSSARMTTMFGGVAGRLCAPAAPQSKLHRINNRCAFFIIV